MKSSSALMFALSSWPRRETLVSSSIKKKVSGSVPSATGIWTIRRGAAALPSLAK
jgi:hypothetical protein